MKAPFPWFGGKRRVAPLIWQTRRGHSGRDLCPSHRVKAVA